MVSMAQELDVVRVQISTTILTFEDVICDNAVSGSAPLAVSATLSLDLGYQIPPFGG
jgi:hypothetical protein